MVGDVSRNVPLPEGQPAQLVGRRVGKDQDQLGESVVKGRGADKPLELRLLSRDRRREGEPAPAAKHRADGPTAHRRQQIERATLQGEPTDIAAEG